MRHSQASSARTGLSLSGASTAAPTPVGGLPFAADLSVIAPEAARPGAAHASTFLLLLLAGDAAFIAIHLLWLTTPGVDSPLYSLGMDRGFAEFYQYVKPLWVIVLLLSVGLRTRTAGYAVWVLLFGYLLVDDAVQVHEILGGHVAAGLRLIPLFGLRPQDFGELAVSATAGALSLGLLGWVYVHGADPFKRATRHLLVFLLTLAFFGIFVDMLHMASVAARRFDTFLGIAEDGGEMLALSFVAWYVFLLNADNGQPSGSLRSLVRTAAESALAPYKR